MELLATWIGGGIAIATFIGALVKQGMDHATAMAELKAENRLQDQRAATFKDDLESLKLEQASEKAHNAKQHEEFYQSNKAMNKDTIELKSDMKHMMGTLSRIEGLLQERRQ
jgi:hypothetical protein